MTTESWSPVIPNGREEALTEEFPGYLREAIFRWVEGVIGTDYNYAYGTKFVDFQNAYRVDLGFTADGYYHWANEVLPHLRKLNDAQFTNLIDYLASRSYFRPGTQHALEKPLSDGGSAWTVIRWNDTYARLAKRVPDGVQAAVRGTLQATDLASVKLQEAWLDAYGTNPRASVAFSHAVVAVEIAAFSVIDTGNPEPTLSNLFSILEAKTPRWTLIFRDSEKAPGPATLAAMLRALWRGHESRHGRPDYADATLDEARAAVILAATLVQWFTSGAVVPAKS